MRALDRRSPTPLWAQMAEDLRERLTAQEFAERFPTDDELVRTYGVSRQTAREAVRHLSDAGLVERQRGRGSFVAPGATFEQPVAAFYSLAQSIEARGFEERSEVMGRQRTRDGAITERLGLPPGSEAVGIRRVRYAGGDPLASEVSWLEASIADAIPDEQLERGSLYVVLAERFGIRVSGGRERIRAAGASPELRRILRLPPGQALLVIERAAHAGARPVEWRVTHARGDRFAFTAEWSGTTAPP